jgi:peptidoglycan/LPS O-acetylase OafA/YrhL
MRLNSIQCFRGIAACLVVAFHGVEQIAIQFFPADALSGPLMTPLHHGVLGVDLFFVVSGFIIAMTTEGSAGLQDALKYLRNRMVRIVPLYWALTLLMVVIVLAFPHLSAARQVTAPWLIGSLLFIPTAGFAPALPIIPVGWTLNYEMLFYLTVFVSIVVRVRMLAPIVLLSFIIAGLVASPAEPGAIWVWLTNSLMLEFLLGFGAFHLFRAVAISRTLAAVFMVGGIAALVLSAGALSPFVPRPIGAGFSFAAIILGAATFEAATPGLKLPNFLVRLGDASYSIYLIQCFTLPFAARVLPMLGAVRLGPDAIWIACVCFTACSGILCFRFIESPLIKAARRVIPAKLSSPHVLGASAPRETAHAADQHV